MSNQKKSLSVIADTVLEIERLLDEHKYDIVMLKSKQLIEYMARKLAALHQIKVSDSEIIDSLFTEGILSQESLENYQRIRLIGLSALQSDDTDEYNAKTSFHLLTQEIEKFSEEGEPSDKNNTAVSEEPTETEAVSSTHREQNGGTMENRKPVKKYKDDEVVELKNSTGIAAKIQRSRTKFKSKRTRNNLIRLGLTLGPFIIVLVFLMLFFFGAKSFKSRKQSSTDTTQSTTVVSETEATLVEETTAAPTITRYVTTSALNVRSAPSTDGEKLTTLAAGTTVDFVGDYDNVWAIINYNGAQAYVSKQYLRLQE